MWILTEIFYDCAQITKSCSRIVDSSTMRCRGLCFIASTDRPWPIEALSLTNFIPKWKTSHGSRQEWRCLAFHGWNIPYLGWRGFLIAGKQFLKSICLLNIQNSLQAIRAKSVNNLSRVEFAQMLKPTWNALETSSSARFECCLDFHPQQVCLLFLASRLFLDAFPLMLPPRLWPCFGSCGHTECLSLRAWCAFEISKGAVLHREASSEVGFELTKPEDTRRFFGRLSAMS